MAELNESLLEDIERVSYQIAREAKQYFDDWQAGKVYIPEPAIKAMGRRYLDLRDRPSLLPLEVYEFGRLYAFFAQMYPHDGFDLTPAGIAIDFCNLLISREDVPYPIPATS